MSDIPKSSGTIPFVRQATTSQQPALSASSLPPPPSGQPPMGTPRFTYPVPPSSVPQPPVVTHHSLVEQYPMVSQLHAYYSFPPPVFTRPRPTVTTQGQFIYGVPPVPAFTSSHVAPPPRAPTPFPAAAPVPPALPPQDPLQANMVNAQSSLVDHLACLMEVVRRQLYWQLRQNESLLDTHKHLQFLWERAMLESHTPTVGDMSSTWSPVQDIPAEQEGDSTNPNSYHEATSPYLVPRDAASSSFHPYLAPNHVVPSKKHRHVLCSKCHQRGHISRLCPQRQRTGCYTCGEPSHCAAECREHMNNPVSLSSQRQAYMQSRRNSSSAASSSGHPPPAIRPTAIRPTSSSEPHTTAPNPPPQTNMGRD